MYCLFKLLIKALGQKHNKLFLSDVHFIMFGHVWLILSKIRYKHSLCVFPNSSPVYPKCCWLSFILWCFCSRPLPGVYHQLYDKGSSSDRAVLDKATSEVRLFTDTSDFSASVALIVTWDRVKQRTVLSTQVSIFHNFWCHFYLKAHKGAEKLTCSFTLSSTSWLRSSAHSHSLEWGHQIWSHDKTGLCGLLFSCCCCFFGGALLANQISLSWNSPCVSKLLCSSGYTLWFLVNGVVTPAVCVASVSYLSLQVEEATFQTVIVSDGRSTYSLIYHLAGAMNWPQRTEWPYVIIGASDGGNSVKTSLNSGTEQAYTSDKQKGNTGINDAQCVR